MSPKSKPATRSSLRQSLNIASKALVDVISKDKKKEAARRASALPSLPRSSMGDLPPKRPSEQSLNVTRRRVSASYQRPTDEETLKSSIDIASPPTKTSTLRPRNLNATSNLNSALPKYRPKSSISEPSKPPSPVRAGTRRRLSTSDEETKEQKRPADSSALAEKSTRPISPLPQRAALKTNLNSVNVTPPASPSKAKTASSKASSPRPTKAAKITSSSSIPRAPSSSSSSHPLYSNINVTPKSSPSLAKVSTPKSSSLRAKFGLSRSAQDRTVLASTPTNESPSVLPRDFPSPLARHSRKKLDQPIRSSTPLNANMTHISEKNETEDSDVEDVALLLAPVAALGAPTPAMPRIKLRKGTPLITPMKSNIPNISLSPDSANESPNFLRPDIPSSQERVTRGSILSWEQLANESSVTLGEDEFGHMLSEVPAPFHSRTASPTFSSRLSDVPESPCLSDIDSPGGYGSISQVLLPDVTPSPAMNRSLLQSRFSLSPEDVDAVQSSAATTVLRLQLAAMGNTAKERLSQMQAMEAELEHLKQEHVQQLDAVAVHIRFLESQNCASDEYSFTIATLQEQLVQARLSEEKAVEEAVDRCHEETRTSLGLALKVEGFRHEMICSARVGAATWDSVVMACEDELSQVASDRPFLSLLLMRLDELVLSL